ncbi:MAG: hypothetical protein RX318_05095 [bacterium]|nr:hypothetical protein [bacterium]
MKGAIKTLAFLVLLSTLLPSAGCNAIDTPSTAQVEAVLKEELGKIMKIESVERTNDLPQSIYSVFYEAKATTTEPLSIVKLGWPLNGFLAFESKETKNYIRFRGRDRTRNPEEDLDSGAKIKFKGWVAFVKTENGWTWYVVGKMPIAITEIIRLPN